MLSTPPINNVESVLACVRTTCKRWVDVEVIALRLDAEEGDVLDALAHLDEQGKIEVDAISDEPRVRIATNPPLSNSERRLLNIIRHLVPDWYTPQVLADFARWTYDSTLDTLAELHIKGLIEVSEYESGPMIRMAEERPVPLTEEQRRLVEDNLDLVVKQSRLACKRPELREDVESFLNFELVEIAQRYDPELGEFRAYAGASLRDAVRSYWGQMYHLRGYKQGKAYDSMPEAEPLELNEPLGPDHFAQFDDSEQLNVLLAQLSPEEREAIVLTEMFEFTQEEASEVTGRRAQEIGEAKRRGLKSLQSPKKNDAPGLDYESDDVIPLPKLLLGIGMPWNRPFKACIRKAKADRKRPCPVCDNHDLQSYAYCLFCDRWGYEMMERMAGVQKRATAATMRMVSSQRRPYRSQIA